VSEPDFGRLAANARRVLVANRRSGSSDWDGRQFDFVCPSALRYPFQWLWDSAFHAIALLHLDVELAKQEIRCLLQAAQPDGFIPHMVLWERSRFKGVLAGYNLALSNPYISGITQPPVLARAVERIYAATHDDQFVGEVLPPIQALFEWLAAHRDGDRDSLLAVVQPDESGLDASPKYDGPLGLTPGSGSLVEPLAAAMRQLFEARDRSAEAALNVFEVEDVMFNAIYADGLRCLSRLIALVGLPDSDSDRLERRSSAVVQALMAKCWDEERGVFWDLCGREEQQLRVLTVTSLFPLILDDLDEPVANRLINEHLTNPAEFWTPFPIPSVAIHEPAFDPEFRTRCVWRGPSWVNVNWYLYWGLRAHGHSLIASEIANRTFDMLLRGGQYEFFNPLTAEGYGAPDFSWSSLVLDLLAGEGKLE